MAKTNAKNRGPVGKRGPNTPPARASSSRAVRSARGARRPRRLWLVGVTVVVFLAIGVLYLIYRGSASQQSAAVGGSGYRHVAGHPGAGAAAPGFTLTAGTGDPVALSDYRGQTVLLYFQEGLSCQPCWDQLRDLENNRAALQNAGVDAVVSITTDPADLVGRKVTDERLSTPVLSDPDLQVSQAYTANQYGMMGDMRDGHTFILVGADGVIRWRADYGGAPDYTMFVPTPKMLTDLTAERIP